MLPFAPLLLLGVLLLDELVLSLLLEPQPAATKASAVTAMAARALNLALLMDASSS
jgi:hypothetical protein